MTGHATESTVQRLEMDLGKGTEMTKATPVLRIVVSDAVPTNTVIVGDFSEFGRARHEDRPLNPNAFAALNLTSEPAANPGTEARP